MPIRADQKNRYPKNWTSEIVPAIRKRSGGRCEACSIKDRSWGWRDERGAFHEFRCNRGQIYEMGFGESDGHRGRPPFTIRFSDGADRRIIEIVLTVAHLDQTPENCDPENLAHLCQRCHNLHDAKARAQGRVSRAHALRAIQDLFAPLPADNRESAGI